MTTVFFLRHGPTKENKEQRIQGQQPGTLIVEETERYISAVVPVLREKSPNVLICSDLERAVGTCDVLLQFLQIANAKKIINPLLREKAMGMYEGMLWKDIPAELQERRGAETYDFTKFGGENDQDVAMRVRELLRQLAQQFPGEKVCCVTHAGWLKQLVKLADKAHILPDGWTDRTAIYEAGVGPTGELQYFHPIVLKANLPSGD